MNFRHGRSASFSPATLGFLDENGAVVLIGPDQKVPNGGRLF